MAAALIRAGHDIKDLPNYNLDQFQGFYNETSPGMLPGEKADMIESIMWGITTFSGTEEATTQMRKLREIE